MKSNQETIELSVVVPVYRSEKLLPELVRRLETVLEGLGRRAEIILVNDASPDGSWDVVKSLQGTHPRVRGISLMRNFGQHAALLAGIQASRGAVVVTMDDDLQTPPEEMPKLLDALSQGHDLVYGIREREQHGGFRNFCSVAAKRVMNKLLGVGVATSITSYKAFRGELRRSFASHGGPVAFIDAPLCWGTTRIGTVVVRHEPRPDGASGYSFRRLVMHTVNMVTSFSHVPLRVASVIGLGATLLGAVLLIYVLAAFVLHGIPVRGFTFLGVAVTLFAGVQLFVLGMIGEYLARMHQRLTGMPAYTIRETVGDDGTADMASKGKEFA